MLVFFLIRYLMQLRPAAANNQTVVTSALSPQINVKHSVIVLAGLLGLHALYSFLAIPFLIKAGFMDPPVEPRLISRGIMLLPALFTCFAAAVMEEFFFRGYAFFRIEESGLERVPALLLVNLIFAAGHLYEGIPAACFALISGIFLSVLVLKKVSLFSLAAAHGIFNFIMILLSFLRHINL
jgi:membrane protease YdiL (CAAX protease family)